MRPRLSLTLFGAVAALASLSLLVIVLVSYQNSIRPVGIVIHHSAVPMNFGGTPVNADSLDKLHALRGFGAFYWGKTYHIGYHYLILPDGTIQKGRPDRCRGAHARGYDSYIGICLVGDFSPTDNPFGLNGPQTPTKEQMRSLTELIRTLQSRYGIPLTAVVRHSDVNPTTQCPGAKFPYDLLQKELGSER